MLVILVARLYTLQMSGQQFRQKGFKRHKRSPYIPSTTLVSQTLTAERPPDMAVNCCGLKILTTFDKKTKYGCMDMIYSQHLIQ